MNDKPISDELREMLWRGQLNEAAQRRLASQPAARAEIELETRLNDTLAGLPQPLVSSNFSARVLQAIDLEESRQQADRRRWSFTGWLPRLATTTAILAFAVLSWQHHALREQHIALAHSLAQVAETAPVPGVEALKNYDAIQRMGQAQPPDDALLALLQ